MANKTEILKSIYYDRSGYGSILNTYKEAKSKDKSITLSDTNKFFEEYVNKKDRQVKGYNSFVAPRAFYEYEVDLFFINDLQNQKNKIGMACIDIFTKYAVVVVIQSKQEGDVAAGVLESINKMGRKPEIIYSDGESSLNSKSMNKYYEENNIKYIATRSSANFVEIFIRHFKNMLYKRIDANKEEKTQWTDYIFEIMLTYNNKLIHNTIGMTPNDARKKENELLVKTNIKLHSNFTRNYPALEVDDYVKIFRKKKHEKERTSNWSDNKYVVENISKSNNLTFYKLLGIDRQYLRHELLKVK